MHDSFDVEKHIKTDFQSFKGLLRLSDKYQSPSMRDILVAFLSSCFPSTLSGFLDARRCDALDGLEVAVVHLAREEDLLEILPAAMYAIATGGSENLFVQGLEMPPGNWVRLERADEINILLARGKMHRSLYDFLDEGRILEDCVCPIHDTKGNYIGNLHVPIEDGEIGPLHSLKSNLECSSEVALQIKEYQEKVWDLLPGWLGLGSWQALKTTRIIA
jgi:hypothetical protein